MDGHQRPPSKFCADPDEELLEYMAMDDGSAGREAAAELYSRHRDFLYGVLRKRGIGRLVGEADLVDLVQDTFRCALTSAKNYVANGGVDHQRQRLACRRWLIGIARNLVRAAMQRPVSVPA